MLNNKTIEKKIVEEKNNDFTPVRGYDLVLYKKNKFDSLVPNGQTPNISWLNKKHYKCFAVSNSDHSFSFRQSLLHGDSVHTFHIDYEIDFRVNDPRVIVDFLTKDPLKEVEKRVKAVLGGYIKKSNWSEIADMNSFQQLKNRALDDMSRVGRDNMEVNFDQIKLTANNVGIEIENIELERTIPEEFLKDVIADVDVDMLKIKETKEHELNLLRKDFAEDLKTKDRNSKRRDDFSGAIDNAFQVVAERISGGVDNIEDLKTVLMESQEIQGLLNLGHSSQSNANNLIGQGDKPKTLLDKTNKKFAKYIYELLDKIGNANLDSDIQRQLISSVFHLISIIVFKHGDDNHEVYYDRYTRLGLPPHLDEEIKNLVKTISSSVEKEDYLL